jgi:endonuclease/exonuclease/phosphatase (EEP) superfamily protein YafD
VLRRSRLCLAIGLLLGSLIQLASVLVSSGLPPVIAMQAFSPIALPVLAVALLLLLLPVGGAVDRRVLVPLALTATLALSAGAVRIAPAWTAAADVQGARIRVMTSNLRLGDADADALLALIRREQPDLVVFPEITPRLMAALESGGLRKLLPYSVGTPQPGARGTMAYAKTPLTDAEPILTEHGSWGFRFQGLAVWGVHPAYPFSPRWERDQRTLSDLAVAEGPDLVLGDFNATVDNPPFRSLLAETGLVDAAEQAGSGWQPTWPTSGFKNLPIPFAAIDHVLVGKDLAAITTRVFDIPGTDHRALVADLAVVGD